jgi:superfamily II DNA or RNA helicase
MPVSFFDSVSKDFPPDSLNSGLSVFHAGGVRKFEHFGELVQAEVRAGMGEYFRVHAKFHTDGRGIQWMDCSCRDNRRRGARCSHLAAFLICIDENHGSVLKKYGLSGGTAEERIHSMADRLARDSLAHLMLGESRPSEGGTAGVSSEQSSSANFRAPSLGQGSVNNAWPDARANDSQELDPVPLRLAAGVKLQKLAHGRESGVLLATVLRSDGREIKYRLGVDDSLALLDWPPSLDVMTDKLRQEWTAGYVVKRVFRVSRKGQGVFFIEKALALLKGRPFQQEPQSWTSWSDLERIHIGRTGVYLKKYGFLHFDDGMDATRETRWADYPSKAQVGSDVAAELFQSQFERLRQTAEVTVAQELAHLKVSEGFAFGPIDVADSSQEKFLIRAKIAPLQSSTDVPSADTPSHDAPTLSLLDIVLARKSGKSFIETKDGWIKVTNDLDWVLPRVDSKGQISLSKMEFIRFHESLGKDHVIRAKGNTIERLCAGLVSQENLKIPTLHQTKLHLRPYQEEGFRWLWWLFENQLGGLLADEMGLGKTHQAMALLAAINSMDRSQPPSLVVCPTTVMDHWHAKISEFLPGVRLFCYYGSSRPQIPRDSGHFIALTSYGILLRDIQALSQQPWSAVILDEAHLVKNQTTRTYQAACQLRSQLRLCLTGTPLENDLFELKTLFDFIVPGYLGPDTAFRKRYISASSAQNIDPLATVELKRLIHPFKMRRTKAEVLTDLPEKVEEIRYCTMSPRQQQLYAQALQLKAQSVVEALASVDGPVPYVHVFAVLTFLKQICDDPGLVHPDYEGIESGKMELLDELLAEALESQQKVVIFSQYARMIGRLSQHLERAGIKHVCLTGQSTNRGATVSAFQNDPEIKVFLGSLLAGGTGIDLTAASVVIHFDRWWNAAKENQATDRIHRIGQQRNVQVFKLITRGTVEEHIDTLIARKRLTFEQYVEDDPQAFRSLSRDDLLRIFTPPSGPMVTGLSDGPTEPLIEHEVPE